VATIFQFDLLIFDLDGVLINSFDDVYDSLMMAFRDNDVKHRNRQEVMNFFGKGLKYLIRMNLDEDSKPKFDAVYASFFNYYNQYCTNKTTLYEGVYNMLVNFRDTKKAILTNKNEAFVTKILKHQAIDHFFDFVAGVEAVANTKPDPAGINLIMNRLAAQPTQTLMIGDSYTDIEAGKNAGTFTCAALYGFGDKTLLINSKPDFQIHAIKELVSLF